VAHPQRTLNHRHHQAELRPASQEIHIQESAIMPGDPRIPDFTSQFITM
jgi:hypothetical protein